VADSRTVFGRVGVRRRRPPRLAEARLQHGEAFKRSLLDAKTSPASGEGSSGRYVAR